MKRNTLMVAGVAVLTAAAVGVGAAAVANGSNAGTATANTSATSSASADQNGQGRHGGRVAQGQGLAGDTAVKVVQAAVAKEPTAVLLRAARAGDGYRVVMRRTDGTRIRLTLDSGYSVTATQEVAKPQRSPKPSTSATARGTS
jgi:hypothetical protein